MICFEIYLIFRSQCIHKINNGVPSHVKFQLSDIYVQYLYIHAVHILKNILEWKLFQVLNEILNGKCTHVLRCLIEYIL